MAERKKIIIYGSIGVLVLGMAAALIFFVKKSSDKDAEMKGMVVQMTYEKGQLQQ